MIISKNHNSLDYQQSLGLDIKQSPNVQDTFRPIPGLVSYTGVIRSVGVLRHPRIQYIHVHLQLLIVAYKMMVCSTNNCTVYIP